MNAAQRWISIGCVCALGLLIVIPPWHQTYKGKPLTYHEEMGHHLLWSPPLPTGEQSWIVSAPASECEVTIKWDEIFWQYGCIVTMGAILCFAFRKSPLTVTNRSLVLTSVLLALCFPVPPLDGGPLLIWIVIAAISPFMDTGHVGPWGAFHLAGKFLILYFTAIFTLMRGVLWIARRYAPNSIRVPDHDPERT